MKTSARNLRRLSAKEELGDALARVEALKAQVAQLQSERAALIDSLNRERSEWERNREGFYERELAANQKIYELQRKGRE